MVGVVDRFEYIITNSELEAFILELNLIKKYDPRYNILLKDDKSYPYIEYVRKPYPSLKVVRYLNIKNHTVYYSDNVFCKYNFKHNWSLRSNIKRNVFCFIHSASFSICIFLYI